MSRTKVRPGGRKAGSAKRPPAPLPLPDQVALLLQGGGALGSYQAGVFEALSAWSIEIDWVAGISIGAINAALIAGNPPERRLGALRQFWDRVSGGLPALPEGGSRQWREWMHLSYAGAVAAWGVPGMFAPRWTPPAFAEPGSPQATSYYDTGPLRRTLDELVDWDLINHGPMRFSIGAVDVESGNFVYFDNRLEEWRGRIDARHILASGALPPGLPAVEIDGAHYWDGGIVSNTPLQYVLDHQRGDMLAFQVDLFSARGRLPRRMSDVWSREKDIRYSSRTRAVTDQYVRRRREHEAVRALLAKLPPDLAESKEARKLAALTDDSAVNVVHLIYRNRSWQTAARDFEFSPNAMADHWQQGRQAVAEALDHGDILAQNILSGQTAAFDLGEPIRPVTDDSKEGPDR